MRVRKRKPIPAAALLAAFLVAPVAGQQSRDTIDVLYVGNSYIYFNNLPGLVEGISQALAGPIVRGVGHTHGGATLRAHIEDNHLSALFPQGPRDWDWVMLQEQSTLGRIERAGQLGRPEAFHEAARELVGMIRAAGAKPALYMTWAKQAFPMQSQALSQAYRSIASELGMPVAPVGEAWAEVLRVRPDFNLHIGDGSHPNPAGSYLAACVIYATLTGRSPIGAPREITGAPWNMEGPIESTQPAVLVSLSPGDAEFLQRTAWKVAAPKGNGDR